MEQRAASPENVGTMPRPPQFIYFDLGNVLLHFDHAIACRQIGQLAGIPEQRVRDVLFGGDLAAPLRGGGHLHGAVL